MKVLRLSFKNLNSLTGTWEIDFKHPDFVASGIFAITGPTGAGKTTILDAVCLALYGQTPRLGRITQSDNEIMSRQTGECWAEVEFETARGRFRCHWSQHRSRKLAAGQLQLPRHEIAEAESGLILESKLKAVAARVEEVTGMDFDRFTRSMLLAQGGFAAFLQARPDERAPILEQITGTAIYSRISLKVHECTTEQRKRLGEMRAELDGARLLSPAEVETLRSEKSDLQRLESTLAAEAHALSEALSWRERIATLEAELLQLNQDRVDFEARKAAAGPDLERLAQAGRAMKLGGEHAHILLLRTQRDREHGERALAEEQLPRLQHGWHTACQALEQAENRLSSARSEQSREAELIRAARELDVRIGEARTQLQAATDEIEKIRLQIDGYRRAITASDLSMDANEKELQKVRLFLEEHQSDAGLSADLAGIEQLLKALSTRDGQCRDSSDRMGRQASLTETATRSRHAAESLWQETLQATTGAEKRLGEIRAAREALLQGRELAAWREDADRLANRLNHLATLQESLTRLADAGHKLAVLQPRLGELERQRRELADQEQALAGESGLREQVARQIREKVLLLNRVRSLEEDRRQLQDGVPCPLCGASEHPYAAGNIPRLDQDQHELEQALSGEKRAREQLSLTRQKLVALDKDLQQAARDRSDLQARILADQTSCAHGAAELELPIETAPLNDPEAWLKIARREAEAGQRQLVNLRNLLLQAEQREKEEQSAQTAHNRIKDSLAEHDRARLAALLGQESALAEQARLEREAIVLQAERDQALTDVKRAVAAYDSRDIIAGTGDQLLADLTARRNSYVQHRETGERLNQVLVTIASERDTQRAVLAESEKALRDRERQFWDRTAQRDALVEHRLCLYGERNPDREEQRLAEALRLAGEQRETALREQNRLKAELHGSQQQIERLRLSLVQLGQELSGRETALFQRLEQFGFADEAAFVQACLPQERFEQLTRWADNLVREETTLDTRLQDRRETLTRELDKNLTDLPLDLIRVEKASVSAKQEEVHRALGGIELTLQQHALQQQLQKDRLLALEAQKKECARWEQLHSLIGSSDGKKFRNFAQGLTFELMVAHANRQLQKMSDRYILVRDCSEPLELNVIDNYQAGEIRSTKNLSGGESFIASLALSLGLSSMASRTVAVDSLFLDEGFGTLDEDALETALETLAGLQQEGKLIGIISHVPALKERIGTRIQVETGSSGRSRLSGPGVKQL